jgi:hypothetical protein
MEQQASGTAPKEQIRQVANRLATDASFREKLETESQKFNELVQGSCLSEFNLPYEDRLALLSRQRAELERRGFLVLLQEDVAGHAATRTTPKTGYGDVRDNGY